MEEQASSLFYELPLELHPLIFLQIDDVETVGQAVQVCKLWSCLATEDLRKSLCLKKGS